MKIAYFVHDLSDAAVAKRVWMLRQAGVKVRLAGFRRTPEPIKAVAGIPALDLGRTSDAQLMRRALSILRNLAAAPFWRRWLADTDAVMARNLEVLALAAACRALHVPRARLAYECLDVHRLMLGQGRVSKALRRVESALLARSDLLIVSSPAFLSAYFEPHQHVSRRPGLVTMVVENKTFDDERRPSLPPADAKPPWRIGWFGMIRCSRSLDFLCDLARRRPDLVQVEIRGRPSYTEFADFDRQVSETPGVAFGGAYRPQELAEMYGALHFNWSVDYFQDEGNSRWLLPNRLYEGGRFGAPPIARQDSETGRWLRSRGLGVLFDSPERELEAWLEALTPQAYNDMAARHRSAPRGLFVIGPEDCDRLVVALGGGHVPETRRGRMVPPVAQQA